MACVTIVGMKGLRSVCAMLFFVASVSAQQTGAPAAPNFEVVSIRLVPPNTPPTYRSQDFTPILPGGQFVDSRTMLSFMIGFAYNMKRAWRELEGLPNWAKNQSFAVAAKAAPDLPALTPVENREQVRLMMRAMLADRFQLRLHSETRQERVFELKAARDGLKIPAAEPPMPPAKEGYVNAAMGDGGGRMIGKKSTMAGMATALSIFLKQPVIDQTGLPGYYYFDISWSAPETTEGQSGGLGAEGLGLLVTTLKDRFGLYLSNSTGPVRYWVVDHIAPPSEN